MILFVVNGFCFSDILFLRVSHQENGTRIPKKDSCNLYELRSTQLFARNGCNYAIIRVFRVG